MTHAALLLLSILGFALLLGAMARHQQDWLRRKLSTAASGRLRMAGFALLALAFLVAGTGFGWGYGTVAWLGSLTIGAALLVTANINRDRILRKRKP